MGGAGQGEAEGVIRALEKGWEEERGGQGLDERWMREKEVKLIAGRVLRDARRVKETAGRLKEYAGRDVIRCVPTGPG